MRDVLDSRAGLFPSSPHQGSSVPKGRFVCFLISMIVAYFLPILLPFLKSYAGLIFAVSNPIGAHRGKTVGQTQSRKHLCSS